jgi:hypothetical protein
MCKVWERIQLKYVVVVAEEVDEQNCVLGITEVVNWMYGY